MNLNKLRDEEPDPEQIRDDMACVKPDCSPPHESRLSLSASCILKPAEIRQFVYKLSPVTGFVDPQSKRTCELGRLEMRWRGGMGEPGRLHTLVNMSQWKVRGGASVARPDPAPAAESAGRRDSGGECPKACHRSGAF